MTNPGSAGLAFTMGKTIAEILDPNSTPLAVARFDPARAREFADRSTSEQTRRAYARVVRGFFAAVGNPDPRTVAPARAGL